MWVPPKHGAREPRPDIDAAMLAHRNRALPQTPQQIWRTRALQQVPLLADADWVRCVAFRGTEQVGSSEPAHRYIERIFKFGFPTHSATERITVGAGMSSGAVATAREWDGVSRYLDYPGTYLFLVAVEGYYLPSVDRQNRSEEVMSYYVPGMHVVAGARVDAVDYDYGQFFSAETRAFMFNHAVSRPPWITNADLTQKMARFIQGLGGPSC